MVRVFDGLFGPEDIQCVLESVHHKPVPGLRIVPVHILRLVEDRLNAADPGSQWEVCGPKAAIQETTPGMYEHVDGSYAGGTHSLVVYLTTPESGGHTQFPRGSSVSPVAGRACLFGVDDLHSAGAAIGRKLVFSLEVHCGARSF